MKMIVQVKLVLSCHEYLVIFFCFKLIIIYSGDVSGGPGGGAPRGLAPFPCC